MKMIISTNSPPSLAPCIFAFRASGAFFVGSLGIPHFGHFGARDFYESEAASALPIGGEVGSEIQLVVCAFAGYHNCVNRFGGIPFANDPDHPIRFFDHK